MTPLHCPKCKTRLGERHGNSVVIAGVGVPLSRSETLTCPKCEKPTTPVTVNRRKKALALKA